MCLAVLGYFDLHKLELELLVNMIAICRTIRRLLLQTMWSIDLYTYVMLLVTWTSHCGHMTMDDIKVHKHFCCII